MKIYFAADHAGFELKNALIEYVKELGHEGEDCGAFKLDEADDYPTFISVAARKLSADVEKGQDSRAVVIGASGQGEAIVANRFKGVRCVLYYGPAFAKASDGQWKPIEQVDAAGKRLDMLASSRMHNDANALSLGARFLSTDEAKAALAGWLSAGYSGEERHARRIKQIDEIN